MNIEKILKELTLEEKASLCSGSDFWHTQEIKRLDIPKIMMSDGPHGLRKMKDSAENPNESIKAVCFPTASALACSFDRTLLETMGKALGESCQAEDVSVILGPGANIKRSPLCGRNFEYFSEDPYLASQMATAHIKGVQSKGIGTSLKHFACNNQETRRMSCSAEVDERTLHEIYLCSFEGAVKNAKPWTIMCSYNRINGEYSSDNKLLLTDVLREKWGFDGLVVSDWGAVNDRAVGIEAGLDLEMPSSLGKNDKLIVKAVQDGTLSEKSLDNVVRNILKLVQKSEEGYNPSTKWDMEKQHTLSGKICSECAVLLKNDGMLPLSTKDKVAFIGKFAEAPRYQGGGSSHINSFKVTSALDAASKYCSVEYAQGYVTDVDRTDNELLDEAVDCAARNDKIVIFAGLPDTFESEGFDRKHLMIPNCQLELINKIYEVNKNITIVFNNGAPIEMPFLPKVRAILEMYLGGQSVGEAECALLFGKVNPSGKLAETFPINLEQNPSYLNFPGEDDKVYYKEGIFVGYRYYEKKKIKPLFPFGYGLSYTNFEYSDISVSSDEIDSYGEVTVKCKIKNVGNMAGKEVVQLYVSDKESSVPRPIKELKGFEKVELKSGETKTAVFHLDRRSFAYYEPKVHDWFVEDGKFDILIGASSEDIKLSAEIYVSSDDTIIPHFDLNSTIGDISAFEEGRALFADLFKTVDMGFDEANNNALGESAEEMMANMASEMPIRSIVSFSNDGRITKELLSELLDSLNNLLENK